MHNQEHGSSIEELAAREADLRQKITELDAAGNKGEEWNKLNLEYEQVQEQLKNMRRDDEQIAA